MRGENLTGTGPYTINVVFVNHVCVSEVVIQREAPNQGASNVGQIEVGYKNVNGSDMRTSTGDPLVLQSPRNNPIVSESTPRCNVQEIDIRILNTNDNRNPYNVRVLVNGCLAPCKFVILRQS